MGRAWPCCETINTVFAQNAEAKPPSKSVFLYYYTIHKMSVVAVAGGTGSIGRSVVEEIVADGKYEVIVLSRKVWFFGPWFIMLQPRS